MHRLRSRKSRASWIHDGVRMVERQTNYLYAQCQTPLLRFTDDLEFWLDQAGHTIHVRSASRLGRRDSEANRKRVEQVRAAYLRA